MTRPEGEFVYGVHPVLELLDARSSQVERIFVSRERRAGFGKTLRMAREAGIPVTHLPRDVLARKVGARAVHQGIAAQVSALPYADVEELCRRSAASGSGLLVLLDGVVDPRNVGAIVRTCAAGGVDGVLIGASGAAGLSTTVAKVSAGTVEHIPVAREPKPAERIRSLRQRGFLTLALDPRGADPWDRQDFKKPVFFVVGGEEKGVRPGLARECDGRVAIPLAEKVESLNVAVALGVLVFEAVRQRRAGERAP